MADESLAAHSTKGGVAVYRPDAGEAVPAKYFSELEANEQVLVVKRVEVMFSREYSKSDKAADFSEGRLVWIGLSRYWALPLQLFVAVALLQGFLLLQEQSETSRRAYEIAFTMVLSIVCALFLNSYAWACEHRAGARRVRMWMEFKRDLLAHTSEGS